MWPRVLSIVAITLLVFSSCTRSDDPPDDPNLPPNGLTGVTFLDQGWSDEVQQLFWFTSQGSQIIPYDWFLVLEQETSEDLFRSETNMAIFRRNRANGTPMVCRWDLCGTSIRRTGNHGWDSPALPATPAKSTSREPACSSAGRPLWRISRPSWEI